MKRLIAIGSLAFLTACGLPCVHTSPPPTGTTTTTPAEPPPPEVTCQALGCPGSPPDPDAGCQVGSALVEGICQPVRTN